LIPWLLKIVNLISFVYQEFFLFLRTVYSVQLPVYLLYHWFSWFLIFFTSLYIIDINPVSWTDDDYFFPILQTDLTLLIISFCCAAASYSGAILLWILVIIFWPIEPLLGKSFPKLISFFDFSFFGRTKVWTLGFVLILMQVKVGTLPLESHIQLTLLGYFRNRNLVTFCQSWPWI
jgi:hypothetical protein